MYIKQPIDMDTARHATAAQIIAQQVYDHQVFCAVLLRGPQLAFRLFIALGIIVARPRTLDRRCFNAVTVQGEEALGGKAHESRVPGQIEIRGERCCGHGPQSPVGVPGVAAEVGTEALGEIYLITISRLDIALYLFERFPVLVGVHIGAKSPGEFEVGTNLPSGLA